MSVATASVHGLAYYKPRPETILRLFCFPYAGGSALIYLQWANYLPPQVSVCPRATAWARTPPARSAAQPHDLAGRPAGYGCSPATISSSTRLASCC